MGLSRKQLSRDEIVIRHMHTHPKVLFLPLAGEAVIIALAILASIFLPQDWPGWVRLVVWVVAVVVGIPVFVLPWLRWVTTTYTITSKRVITRLGILNKTGHDLPLSRISDVSHERSLSDRFFGCGTLTLQTSSDDPLPLNDVPRVGLVQMEIANLLFNDVKGAIEADPND